MSDSKNDFDSLYGGKYLAASDIEGNGFVATIENVTVEKMRDGGRKAVVALEGYDRGVVLNKTRAKVLVDLAGSKDYDDWIGLKVKVTAGVTNFGGDTVPCLQLSKPPLAKEPLKEEMNDDLPTFAK